MAVMTAAAREEDTVPATAGDSLRAQDMRARVVADDERQHLKRSWSSSAVYGFPVGVGANKAAPPSPANSVTTRSSLGASDLFSEGLDGTAAGGGCEGGGGGGGGCCQ